MGAAAVALLALAMALLPLRAADAAPRSAAATARSAYATPHSPTPRSAPDPSRLGEVAPELAGFSGIRLARVDSAIHKAIRDGATPGAALAIGREGKLVRLRGYGRIDWNPFTPEVTDSTLYDIASLTKVVGTATAALLLVREGRLNADVPVHRYLTSWPRTGPHGQITIRHLLLHTSGLPAGLNLWAGVGTRNERIERIARARITSAPGTRRVYSDIGMILLAAIVEKVSGERLDWYLEQQVFSPLAMHDTRFNPLRTPGSYFDLGRIAPTEFDRTVRGRHVHGEVHDLNALALGGVAGHAGMFSSARDLAVFAQTVLDAALGRPMPLTAGNPAFGSLLMRDARDRRPLGWDIPAGASSSAGAYFSAASFGHNGFTGTSIWIDPERQLYVVLLTNRLNPTARNQKHVSLRRDVHDLVQLALLDPPRRRGE